MIKKNSVFGPSRKFKPHKPAPVSCYVTQGPSPNHNKSHASLLSLLSQAIFRPAWEVAFLSSESLTMLIKNLFTLTTVSMLHPRSLLGLESYLRLLLPKK